MNKIELLKEYDIEYYNHVATVSDTEYDLLKEEARNEFPDDPYFQTVGTDSDTEKVVLPFILGSLDKVKIDTVSEWLKGKGSIVASHKLDGISFMCTWRNGKVVFAATRGNGTEGQDITDKMKQILPDISVNFEISLRGELLLFGDDYIKLGYKNRRNGVNGALAHHVEYLHPIFYEVLNMPNRDDMYESDRLSYIETLGLDVAPYELTKNVTVSYLTDMLIKSKSMIYDTDGIVITVNNSFRENVKYPKSKVAFKVNTEATRVTVKHIDWRLGRTGRLTPRVFIEPIKVDGVTITKATAFNYEYIKNNGIDKGAIVGIIRANGVIPYITGCFKPSDVCTIPDVCPSCGARLYRTGVDLICDNPDCYDANVRQIAHFFKTLGSEYVTETTIRNLGVESIEDMYNLDELDIANIDGFGIKKAEQVYYEIQKTLSVTPDKLLAAFGISGIGTTLAPSILESYSFDELFTVDDITDIEGVGEVISDNLVLNINKYMDLYEFMKERGLKFISKEKSSITGLIFTLTGKMPMKRDVVTKLITSKGGLVKGISKSTNYLVTDDVNSGSDKNKKAKSYGTEIIDFNTLMDMIK